MMGWRLVSRAAATCAALAIIAVSAPARAQESDAARPARSGDVLELQFGGGYLFRDGDLASLPSVELGVVLWWSQSWGFSLRRSMTIGEHMASYDYGDGVRTGGRNFRHWTGTLRYRAVGSALELNLGAGLTFGAYDHLTWHPGAGPNSRPEVGTGAGIGGLLGEVLVGRRIAPRLSIKAGLVVYAFLDEDSAVVPVALGVVSF